MFASFPLKTDNLSTENCFSERNSGDLRHPRPIPVPLLLPGLAGFADLVAQSRSSTLRHSRPFPASAEKKSSTASPAQPECAPRLLHFDCAQSSSARESRLQIRISVCRWPRRRIRRLHFDGFTQFTLNGPAPCTCTMVSPLLIAKCRISSASSRISDVHGCQFCSSKVSPMRLEGSLQYGYVFVRRMPCAELGSVNAPEPAPRTALLRVWVAPGHRRKIASLDERSPLHRRSA